jgi:hypothetical protein
MKKIFTMLSFVMLASCSYIDLEDPKDYSGYYNSRSAVDQLEYKEATNANLKNQPAEVNGHAVEVPKTYAAPKNGVPLEAPAVN